MDEGESAIHDCVRRGQIQLLGPMEQQGRHDQILEAIGDAQGPAVEGYRIRALYATGRPEDAYQRFRAFADADPDAAAEQLATVAYHDGDEALVAAADRILDARADHPRALWFKGAALGRLGDRQGARRALQTGLSRVEEEPDLAADLHRSLAAVLLQGGDSASGAEHAARANALEATPEGLDLEAQALLGSGRRAEAARAARGRVLLGRDQYLVDLAPVHVHDFEAPALVGEALAFLRQVLEHREHVAGDGRELAILAVLDSQPVGEGVRRQRPGHEQRTIAALDDARLVALVLIAGDLAGDRGQQAGRGDDPVEMAVFVMHHRHRDIGMLQHAQRVDGIELVGHDLRLAGDRAQIDLFACHHASHFSTSMPISWRVQLRRVWLHRFWLAASVPSMSMR